MNGEPNGTTKDTARFVDALRMVDEYVSFHSFFGPLASALSYSRRLRSDSF